jgi:hypothetical protein
MRGTRLCTILSIIAVLTVGMIDSDVHAQVGKSLDLMDIRGAVRSLLMDPAAIGLLRIELQNSRCGEARCELEICRKTVNDPPIGMSPPPNEARELRLRYLAVRKSDRKVDPGTPSRDVVETAPPVEKIHAYVLRLMPSILGKHGMNGLGVQRSGNRYQLVPKPGVKDSDLEVAFANEKADGYRASVLALVANATRELRSRTCPGATDAFLVQAKVTRLQGREGRGFSLVLETRDATCRVEGLRARKSEQVKTEIRMAGDEPVIDDNEKRQFLAAVDSAWAATQESDHVLMLGGPPRNPALYDRLVFLEPSRVGDGSMVPAKLTRPDPPGGPWSRIPSTVQTWIPVETEQRSGCVRIVLERRD